MVGLATLIALALSVLIGAGPILAAIVIVIAGIQLVRSPDNAVWIVAAILYSNAAVIGARFHGIPFVIAAAFPLLLCLPIARDLLLRGLSPVIAPALPFVLAFLVVQLVGALFSVAPERSLEGVKTFLFEGLLLFVLFTNAIRTPEVLRRVLWAVTLAGAGLGTLVAYQQLTGSYSTDFGGFAQLDADGLGFYTDGFRGEGAARQKRIGGPIGEPNRWAQIMLVLVPIALFQVRASSRRLHKLIGTGVCIAILVGGSLGFSRGGAVGFGFTVLLMTLMGYVKGRHIAAAAAGLLVVALLVPQYAVRLGSLGNVLNLASSTSGPGLENADSGTRGRITEMVAAGLVFADHPFVGVGPKMFREHYIEYARIAGGRARGVPSRHRCREWRPGAHRLWGGRLRDAARAPHRETSPSGSATRAGEPRHGALLRGDHLPRHQRLPARFLHPLRLVPARGGGRGIPGGLSRPRRASPHEDEDSLTPRGRATRAVIARVRRRAVVVRSRSSRAPPAGSTSPGG
jgi:O-antigen ligase